MGYPSTNFIWDDQTIKRNSQETSSLAGKPILMAVSSADKGPENFRVFDSEYEERYGAVSFAKHGQSQVQVNRILNAGGAVYYRRIVAPDATLANLSCVATVSQVSTQKVDATGAKLYKTPEGIETTAAEGNTPIMETKAKVKYDTMAITDLATLISVGDNPKEIARLVKEQVDLANTEANTSHVERVPADDLTTMGHATVTYNLASDVASTTVVAKGDAVIEAVYLKAGSNATTIADFGVASAVNVTANAATGFGGVTVGENTICVTYTDKTKYPSELFHVTVKAADTATATGTTVLDKSALKALITACQSQQNADYTDASWGAFQIAMSAAVLALGDECNQGKVSTARVDLQFAKDSLTTKAAYNAIPKKFLLWTVTDTGRGDSAKRIAITPNYQASKNSTYTKYMMSVIEGTESTDTTLMFSMNPDIIDQNINRRLDTVLSMYSMQLRGVVYENDVNDFFTAIATNAGVTEAVAKEADILFGYVRKGKIALDWLEIDHESAALNTAYGLALMGGSNGSFGNAPMDSPAYYDEIVKSFNGTITPDIYDMDNVTIHAIFDAGYPIEVKHAIEALVSFREDCFYFRDLGINDSLVDNENIITADEEMLKSKFCATYHNFYDVYDELTKKQITVTCMYHLAPAFVTHYKLGINRPYAGILHGFVFPDVIEGTVNYVPKKIPGDDQPQELYDANINYMKYYAGQLTLENEKTSQEVDSELSYINNVLAIQDIIRIVRERCPRLRYTFKTGDDFVKYQQDINQVLSSRVGFFDSLELVYLENMAQTDSKCYFAAIKVDCKDFIESEYFKVSVI